jgi:hypothetical protein
MWTSPNLKPAAPRRGGSTLYRSLPVQWLVGAAALVALSASGAVAAQASSIPASSSARTLNVTDEAHLHVTHSSGSLLEEEGAATGALPGTVRVSFRVATTISGSFTIYPRGGGSITGIGSARLHSGGSYASFSGSISVSHGTGPYAHAHGTGGFYGTVDRRNNALVIQTTGRLSY